MSSVELATNTEHGALEDDQWDIGDNARMPMNLKKLLPIEADCLVEDFGKRKGLEHV